MSSNNYSAAELMVYFEKTRFLEVLRVLILRIGMERPLCIKHYLRKNLRQIANTVLTKNTIVHLPCEFDVHRFVSSCLKMYRIPIFTYNTRGKRGDALKLDEILGKFEKFCRKHGLHKKNKIYMNFPQNFNQILQVQNCSSPPTNFIHVTADDPISLDFKDVLDFYNCNMKIVPVKCHDDVDGTPIEEAILPEVMYKVKYSPKIDPFNIGANFLYRVLFIGKRGSGRKTQARLIADRFNSVFISIRNLIEQTLQSKDNMAKVLCVSYKREKKFSSSSIMALLWRRLLQNDALTRGWVVVGFPSCVMELQTIIEKFQTPPNRVVVIHCSKTVAMRRMIQNWEHDKFPMRTKVNTTTHVEKELEQWDQKKGEMYAYLKSKATVIKTVHVDGASCMTSLRNKILALMDR